jgi:hypothetical protein
MISFQRSPWRVLAAVAAAIVLGSCLALPAPPVSADDDDRPPRPTNTPTLVPTLAAHPPPTNTPAPTPTLTPTPIEPRPIETRVPTVPPKPTATPVPIDMPTPAPTDTPTPRDTPTPAPTSTVGPMPSATPTRPPAPTPTTAPSGRAAAQPSTPPPPKSVFVPTPSSISTRAAAVITTRTTTTTTATTATTADPVAATLATGFSFVGGFASLNEQLGAIMGDPLESQRGDGNACDIQQLTTTGMAYWLCALGAPAFVASPDGSHHWALIGDQMVEWFGPTADPPSETTALTPILPANCMDPNVDLSTPCMLTDGASVLGFITSAGDTNTYRLDIGQSEAEAIVQLTDLPADYDLYLADNTGALLGASAQEGTAPETIDLSLTGGTYYVYVHSDPAREVAQDLPYRLSLIVNTPATAGP